MDAGQNCGQTSAKSHVFRHARRDSPGALLAVSAAKNFYLIRSAFPTSAAMSSLVVMVGGDCRCREVLCTSMTPMDREDFYQMGR
jgi:hypothetical protein